MVVPKREDHLKAVEQLKQHGTTKVLGAPFFPYDGCAFLMETEGDRQTVEQFVKSDPYVKGKLVQQYQIKEFDGATVEMKRRFDRFATEFVYRN